MPESARTASVRRETRETTVSVELSLDGRGRYQGSPGYSARFSKDAGATWTSVAEASLSLTATGTNTDPYTLTASGLNLADSLTLNRVEFTAQDNAGNTGTNTVTVTAGSLAQVTFTATGSPIVASSMAIVSGNNLSSNVTFSLAA